MKKIAIFRSVPAANADQQLAIVGFFHGITHWLALPLRAFTRKNMGSRYFHFLAAVLVLVGLATIPYYGTYIHQVFRFFPYLFEGKFERDYYLTLLKDFKWLEWLLQYASWYGLLYLAWKKCMARRKESKRKPNQYDFKVHSMDGGIVWSRLQNFRIRGEVVNIRQIDTLVEPGLFFLVGAGLLVFGQWIGVYPALVGLMCAASAGIQYWQGDIAMQIMIDNHLDNGALTTVVTEGDPGLDTQDESRVGRTPVNQPMRHRLSDADSQDGNDDGSEGPDDNEVATAS